MPQAQNNLFSGDPIAVYHFENGWSVQVDHHSESCSGYLEIPSDIYFGELSKFANYLLLWNKDPRNEDKKHNGDTELIVALYRIATRRPIGEAGKHAAGVNEMIKKATKK